MKNSIVYLGSASYPLDLTRRCLAHEPAHGLAYEHGIAFWQAWDELFPKPAVSDWNNKDLARSLGMLSPYALFDYNEHQSASLHPPKREGRLIDDRRVPIISYEFAQPKSVDHIVEAYDSLPLALRRSVKMIGIYTAKDCDAAMRLIRARGDSAKGLFGKVAEDISMHSEDFLDMFYNPHSNREHFELLRESILLQKRLDMLEEKGFIERDQARFVREVTGIMNRATIRVNSI